jgi:diguanylate cyclase (GGDEF)-like protein
MTLRDKRRWFTIISSLLMIVVLSVATIESFRYFSLSTIRAQGRMAAEMLRISLTEQMRKGVIGQRQDLFVRMREIPGLTDVRVLRGEPVIRQYGPGHDDEAVLLTMEKRVLATGLWEEELLTKNDTPIYRITIPYIARSTNDINCLECHNVAEGTVNGAVTLAFSLAQMRRAEIFSITPLIILLGLFGIALGYFLKRLFNPLVETAESLTNVVAKAQKGDFSGRIKTRRGDEIGQIAQETNNLMKTLEESIGNISHQIQSLGDSRNLSGQTNLLSHTTLIVKEMVGAARFKQSVENDMDLDEIYARIRRVLKDHFKFSRFSFYEVVADKNHLLPIFIEGLDHSDELWCDAEVLLDCNTCRAKRIAERVSSVENPHICNRFIGHDKNQGELVHICLPMTLSGTVGGILQIVLSLEEAEKNTDLAQSLNIYLKESAPVIESRRLMRSLKETTLRDPMTGLYNRRFLEDFIENLTASIKRRETTLGVLMCDVDFFKQVNDNYGHDVGDQILKELANILRQASRSSDFVIRYGGEEFVILLPDADENASMIIAERIRTTMEGTTFPTPQGPLHKTLSIGIALFPGDGKIGFWECVKHADIALYKAKETGRNQCLHFTAEMRADPTQY